MISSIVTAVQAKSLLTLPLTVEKTNRGIVKSVGRPTPLEINGLVGRWLSGLRRVGENPGHPPSKPLSGKRLPGGMIPPNNRLRGGDVHDYRPAHVPIYRPAHNHRFS